MFKTVLCSTLVLVAGSAVVAMADAQSDLSAAAAKLSDASNYSWKSTSEGGAGGGGGRGGAGGPVEGKTEKGGFTVLTMTRGDMSTQVVIKGDKVAMQNQQGDWQSSAEMAAAAAAQQADPNAQGGGRRRGGRGGMGAQYANYKLPAETAADLATKSKNLASADGAITGELTEDGAKTLMAFNGGRGGRRGGAGGANGGAAAGGAGGPQIANAKGTVKFWVKDGVLSKYESHVSGTMSRNGNDTDIERTSTVEITDVGSTKVEVPDAAKKKFE